MSFGDAALRRGWERHAVATLFAAYSMIEDESELYEVVLGTWQELKANLSEGVSDEEITNVLGIALSKQVANTMDFE